MAWEIKTVAEYEALKLIFLPHRHIGFQKNEKKKSENLFILFYNIQNPNFLCVYLVYFRVVKIVVYSLMIFLVSIPESVSMEIR